MVFDCIFSSWFLKSCFQWFCFWRDFLASMCQSKQHRYVTLYNWSLIVQLELYLIGRYYTIRLKLCQLFQGLLDDIFSVVDGENIILSSFYLLDVFASCMLAHIISLLPPWQRYTTMLLVTPQRKSLQLKLMKRLIGFIPSLMNQARTCLSRQCMCIIGIQLGAHKHMYADHV